MIFWYNMAVMWAILSVQVKGKRVMRLKFLKMGMEYAKSLSIEKLMLACFSDTLPSIKTIIKCGGILFETKPYTDGQLVNIPNSENKLVNIYWIDI